jgi:hypothetical protein
MGVIYKLRDEVVQFIISQRQGNPLSSCRQLAESASQKFGLHLSKSSVHDVLKESGIVTPRGRKPKEKFEIPHEKKKQIQASLSQIKLISPPEEPKASLIPDVAMPKDVPEAPAQEAVVLPETDEMEVSTEYEGAGRVFFKAALWDLGIFLEENIRETDWDYYLTYCKGVKLGLENDKSLFIELNLPIERCIRETADGIINNIKPLIVQKVSDEDLFKSCMEAQPGFKIDKISIVDQNDHILFEINDIVEFKRNFSLNNRIFVVSKEKNISERAKSLFFSQNIDNNDFIENIMNFKGFDEVNKEQITINLLIEDSYVKKQLVQEAAEKLNGMLIQDDQDRLVKVKIQA